jgi:flavorubredoxin
MTEQWLENVDSVLEGRKPDYLVIHHLEPDHSAGILKLHEKYPDMRLVGNALTFRMLPQFIEEDLSSLYVEVDDGWELSLGSHKLTFFKAPMVHWPEVMVSYESSDKVLFSADAFGKFGTATDTEDWACEARRYYFNIVGKYGQNVQMLLGRLKDLDVKVICPLHGPVLSDRLDYYVGIYNTWSSYEPEDKGIFIACSSIHGNTLQAAKYLEEKLNELSGGSVKVVLTDLCRSDWAEAVEDAFRYDRMVLMSSSYNTGVFPPMENFLHHLAGDNYCRRKLAVVENGTWAPSAARTIKSIMEPCRDITWIGDVITIKTRVTDENLAQLTELARKLLEV